MNRLNPYAKAVISGLIAGAGTFGASASSGGVTATEWAYVVVAALVGFLGTWAVPNTPSGSPGATPTAWDEQDDTKPTPLFPPDSGRRP